LAYQGEGVDEEGAAAVGLDELRDGAGAGRGRRPPLRPLLVPVQEHRAPAGDGGGGHLLLLLLTPRDAAVDREAAAAAAEAEGSGARAGGERSGAGLYGWAGGWWAIRAARLRSRRNWRRWPWR